MSKFVDRLEQELVAAGRRSVARRSATRARMSVSRTWESMPSGALVIAMVLAVTAVVAGGAILLPRRHVSTGSKTSQTPVTPAVAFITGLSTDPGAASHPAGLGVATNLTSGHPTVITHRSSKGPYSVSWLSSTRLLVQAGFSLAKPPGLVYRLGGGALSVERGSPLRAGDNTYFISPDGRFIATEPWRVESCGAQARVKSCITPRRQVWVEHADGSHRSMLARGFLEGWAPNDRAIVSNAAGGQFSNASYRVVSVTSGAAQPVISSSEVARFAHVSSAQLGGVAYSGDGRYLAVMVLLGGLPRSSHVPLGNEEGAIVLARPGGAIVRLIRSPSGVSMIAWSPSGDMLAYTTGTTPAFGRVALLTNPSARAETLRSGPGPFSWISWSPDSRSLLLDDPSTHSWRLFHFGSSGALRASIRLPRLGGAPTWCCVRDNAAGS